MLLKCARTSEGAAVASSSSSSIAAKPRVTVKLQKKYEELIWYRRNIPYALNEGSNKPDSC